MTVMAKEYSDEKWKDDLWDAARKGNVETVRHILEKLSVPGTCEFLFDPWDADEWGYHSYWTPMHHACWNGHIEVVRLLLDAGASVNITNGDGESPFNDACEFARRTGDLSIVRLLLERNVADVDTTDNYESTPLHDACWGCHADLARLLLEHGADVDARDIDGYTPIDYFIQDVLSNPNWQASYGREVFVILCEFAPDKTLGAVLDIPEDEQSVEKREMLLSLFRERFPEQYFSAFCTAAGPGGM